MKSSLGSLEDATGTVPVEQMPCDRCGGGVLSPQRVKIAFWSGDGLVVVRNIPAMVCGTCGEEYLSDHAAMGLDRMRGEGFAAHDGTERISVPVIDFVEPGPEQG